MDLQLEGKTAIVGGASQGIGLGIARALAAEGARVVISGRREERLKAAADRLRQETGAAILCVAADVRKNDDCERVVSAAVAEFGAVDILVNNDGAPPIGTIETFDDTAWEKAFEQNILSVVRMVRQCVPHMRRRGGGSIVNIAAVSAIQPAEGYALSASTWAGILAYAKTLSIELGPSGITVNTILPGFIDTPRLQKVLLQPGDGEAAARDALRAQNALGRIGSVEDVAALAVLLASPRGSFITGTATQVDGGMVKALR